ncbi:MAG: hypothetical protein K9H41_09980 [Bacteroidia bacterium]|nr:hypothetical protein [Bacteroidia bacterium]
MENKINYLSLAINDAQELIRFIDTKTAIIITILGSYIVGFFVSLDKIAQYSIYYSCFFWFLLILFIITLTVCIIVTSRIIKPTNNPSDNITFGNATPPAINFFIAPNNYIFYFPFCNSKKHKLKISFKTFQDEMNLASDAEIVKSLSYELLKVSFIRNIKNDRFNFLIKCLVVNTIIFIIAYLFYSFETQNAIEIIEMLKKYRK